MKNTETKVIKNKKKDRTNQGEENNRNETQRREAVLVTMGLGTAAFNQMVATSGVAARRLVGLGARNHKGTQAISATLHLTVGLMIIALSVGMLLP